MKNVWRRLRASLGLGAIWAGGGAFIGALVELASNLFPALPVGFIDMWIPTLAIPGFIGGVIFSGVLGVAARHRRFDELSLPGIAALGVGGGVVLGLVMMALGAGPLILVPATVLSGLGASLSLGLARLAERPEPLEAGSDVDGAGLSAAERRELLG